MPPPSPTLLADVVLLVMLAEGAMLARNGRGWAVAATALLPGALLVLALRAALGGASWPLVALPLTLSFPAHLLDLHARGWLERRKSARQ